MITIIDYGIGNLRSIEKAFEHVGAAVVRTDRPDAIAAAERLVLPGVGAFGACADEVRRRGLERPIHDAVRRGTPFFGVCVGMQLLFDVSEEHGLHTGLGLLPGRVVRFDGQPAETTEPVAEPAGPSAVVAEPPTTLKVPHMGWNTVEHTRPHPLVEGIERGAYFYFVHSYHAVPDRSEDVLGRTTYGIPFPAIVARDNVFGAQFHPEKSHRSGLAILRNFASMPV